MTSITNSKRLIDINHLAKLSNLKVNDKEIKKLSGQFEETLKVISQLNEIDTKKINPTYQVTGKSNFFRDDCIVKANILTQKEALSNGKSSYSGYFLINAVFSES
jgi:aspartyl/glutamyl-tRNA(Asn/Gln) amidotransferase C subunit